MKFLWLHRCACESSRPRARLQSEGLIKVLLAIGTVLNTPDPAGTKALWLPAQQARFLGFTVDAAQQRFLLPEDKKQAILQLTSSIISSSHVTNRQLARVAGKMIAATPAVPLGPLFARAVYKAMIGKAAWDTVYPAEQAAIADIQSFQQSMLAAVGGCNGLPKGSYVDVRILIFIGVQP